MSSSLTALANQPAPSTQALSLVGAGSGFHRLQLLTFIFAPADYRNWQMPLGRRFRSLKLYFVLRSYGVSGFQAHLRKLVDLTKHFEELVTKSPTYELFVPRRFSLVCVRLVGATEDAEKDVDADKLNKEFHRLSAERKDSACSSYGCLSTALTRLPPLSHAHSDGCRWPLLYARRHR